MKNYSLLPDEVLLFEGPCYLHDEKHKIHGDTQCLLTNLNLVFVSTINHFFQKSEIEVKQFPVNEIKMYNGTPQIKQSNKEFVIYFRHCDITFDFISSTDAFKFFNKAIELLTGRSVTERGAEKVKSTLNLVDNTLGINTTDALQSAFHKGAAKTAVGILGKALPGGRMTKMALGVASNLFSASQNQPVSNTPTPSASGVDSLESLKKLKELVDAGVITQEEFDAKKKQILNL